MTSMGHGDGLEKNQLPFTYSWSAKSNLSIIAPRASFKVSFWKSVPCIFLSESFVMLKVSANSCQCYADFDAISSLFWSAIFSLIIFKECFAAYHSKLQFFCIQKWQYLVNISISAQHLISNSAGIEEFTMMKASLVDTSSSAIPITLFVETRFKRSTVSSTDAWIVLWS